jgi:beta-N-acetylhexosaminidase
VSGALIPIAASLALAAPAPATTAATEPLAKQVGRMIMTGYAGPYPDAATLYRVRRGEVGGVILMGENVGPRTGAAIRALQAEARRAGRRLLIATDQEGGLVKRFAGAPTTSAAGMRSAAAARVQGRRAAALLRRRGVTTNLAPVADVRHARSFIGSRSFSASPAAVAQRACGFTDGLHRGGVHATMKHFPGLGYARRNTDEARVTITRGRSALERDLQPYRRCTTELVMVSNAVYRAYDARNQAVLSRRIVEGLLRDELRYKGVVISDSLTVPAVAGPTTAVRATRAGVDMLLVIPQRDSARAYRQVLAAARRGEVSRARVRGAAERIAALAGAPR